MSYPINYPTPQNANVQVFSFFGLKNQTWVKPQGASFVWFTLIGAGAGDDGAGSGGSSGNVTNFMCPAFLIPDTLVILIGKGGTSGVAGGDTVVLYQQKEGSGYNLLQASGGSITGANTADTAKAFAAIGFYQSIAGQAGSTLDIAPSSTTFLSGGGSAGGTQVSNYGYTTQPIGNNRNGFFQMQPIIVGAGGMGTENGGVGCGGGINSGKGGNGLAVIITW